MSHCDHQYQSLTIDFSSVVGAPWKCGPEDMGRDSWDWVGPLSGGEHDSILLSGVEGPRLLKRGLTRFESLFLLLLSCYSKTGIIHYCQGVRPWRKHFRQWWSRLAECLQHGLANRTLDTLDGTETLKPQSVVLVAPVTEDREMQITLQQFRRRGVHGEVFQFGELRFTSISGIRSITTQTTNGCIVFVPGGHCART